MKPSLPSKVSTPLKQMNGKAGKTQSMTKAPTAKVMKPRAASKKMPQRKPNGKMGGLELLRKALRT